MHDKDPDLFFLVPWTGDEYEAVEAKQHDESDEAGCLYVPFTAHATYVAWHCKDDPECKVPRPVTLFLGRGVWRHRRDLQLASRVHHLTEESVIGAMKVFADTLTGLLKHRDN